MDCTTEEFNVCFGNTQPETLSLVGTGQRDICLVKAIKYLLLFVHGNTSSGIENIEFKHSVEPEAHGQA